MKHAAERRFLTTVERALTRIGVARGATILVALSGGPDSVAMLHALRALKVRFSFRIVAAHLNHGIRGDEADRDEAFVRNLCARCDIQLVVKRARTLSANMPNLEERAREARYAFLNSVADRIGADYLALAHQADDQAETVLMRMLRGAGVAGLAAMSERGPGRIIRPLLSVTRAEVMAYLEGIGEGFVNDSSNQSDVILRSRVRGELIPTLERQYAPGLRARLVRLASEMRAVDDFIVEAARRELAQPSMHGGLDLVRFAQLHPALQAEVIRCFIAREAGNLRRIERSHIEAIRHLCLEGPPNGILNLPGIRMIREYDVLKASRERVPSAPFMVKLVGGQRQVPEANFAFETRELINVGAGIPASKFEALFDASEAQGNLIVRSFRNGDRIAPLGMRGHRKVQDIFVDHKVSRAKRATFPIVELKGEVAWLPGLVRGRVGLITEATENVLLIRATTISLERP